MKRNPEEIMILKYIRKIKFKEFTPKLFWYQCCKCGNEFKKEPMYSVQYPIVIGHNFMDEQYGCSHCFSNMENFKECVWDKYISKSIED